MKNKFKFFLLLTALVCLMAVFTVSASADTVIDAEVVPTSFDSLSVEFSGGATFLTSTQFYLSYDAEVLEYNSDAVISERTGDFATVQKIEDGKLLVNFFAATHAYKNEMFRIDFNVLNTNSSNYGFATEIKNIYVSRDNSGADSSVLTNGSINWIIPTVVSIKHTIDPSEVFYNQGQENIPTYETLSVYATWSNGVTVEVPKDSYTIVPPAQLLGFAKVGIKFRGLTDEYTIAIGVPLPEYIEIRSFPEKLNYLQDSAEAFDTTGLSVFAYYPEQEIQWIELEPDEYSIEGFNTAVDAGTHSVYVVAYNQQAEIEITIDPDIPDSIEIKQLPDLVKYKQNSVDEILLSGIVVEASFDKGLRKKTVDPDDLVVSGFDPAKLGKQTITVTYRTRTAKFTVEVEPLVVYPSSIEIIALPIKLEYFLDTEEKLVTTGLKVKGIYDNGDEENIRLNDLEITGFDPTVEGPQTITIRYFETTATFEINIVKQPDPTEPRSLVVEELPTKQEYTRYSSEELDLTGIVLKAVLGNGEIIDVPVEEVSVAGFDLTSDEDMQLISLTYKGCTAAIIIAIIENTDIMYGDVDGNGALSASDARLALRYSAGLEGSDWATDMLVRADFNRDGSVTSYDARAILRASVGLSTD